MTNTPEGLENSTTGNIGVAGPIVMFTLAGLFVGLLWPWLDFHFHGAQLVLTGAVGLVFGAVIGVLVTEGSE